MLQGELIGKRRQREGRDSPPPSNTINQQTAQWRPNASTRSIDNIDITLPHAPLLQRDNITQQNAHHSCHATAANARKSPCSYQLGHGARQAAETVSETKDQISKEKAGFAAEDIAEFAVEGLEGG